MANDARESVTVFTPQPIPLPGITLSTSADDTT